MTDENGNTSVIIVKEKKIMTVKNVFKKSSLPTFFSFSTAIKQCDTRGLSLILDQEEERGFFALQ